VNRDSGQAYVTVRALRGKKTRPHAPRGTPPEPPQMSCSSTHDLIVWYNGWIAHMPTYVYYGTILTLGFRVSFTLVCRQILGSKKFDHGLTMAMPLHPS
jgi:hypothetical protein